jgi:hypothetical protein
LENVVEKDVVIAAVGDPNSYKIPDDKKMADEMKVNQPDPKDVKDTESETKREVEA